LWTIPLLGNAETTEETPENLTPLEEALLLDIASALVKALSDLHDSFDFNTVKDLEKGLLPLYLDSTDELCRIAFNAQQADSKNSSDAYILLPCKMLEPVVGKTANTEDKYSPEKVSRAILEDFQKTNITVTGQLDSIMLTFEEIVSLQPDDILLLDKKIDEPLDVVVDGVTVLRGSLAKSTGKYATVITEFCKPMQDINNIPGTLT
jgi:flagellar motor switch protein FliM